MPQILAREGFVLTPLGITISRPMSVEEYQPLESLGYHRRQALGAFDDGFWISKVDNPFNEGQFFVLTHFLREILNNAIQHGTAFLEKGKIEVRWALGDRGLVCGIEQEPPYNLEELLIRGTPDDPQSYLTKRFVGNVQVPSGNGLANAVRLEAPKFWVDQKGRTSESVVLSTISIMLVRQPSSRV